MASTETSQDAFRRKCVFYRVLDGLDDDSDVDETTWKEDQRRRERLRGFTEQKTESPTHQSTTAPVDCSEHSIIAPAAPPQHQEAVIDRTVFQEESLHANSARCGPGTVPEVVVGTDPVNLVSRPPGVLPLAMAETMAGTTSSPVLIDETPVHVSTGATRRRNVKDTTIVSDSFPMAPTAMSRKRRRTNQVKLVPEAERVFAHLSFFYIPDNDVHPARRIRILKAREHGADWVRDVKKATHVIVDRNLQYKDIASMLVKCGTDRPVVVTEEYPVDCLRFKRLLNPEQRMYKVKGQPEAPATITSDKATGTAEADHTARDANKPEFLKLKPLLNKQRSRFDHDSPGMMPPRSQDLLAPPVPSIQIPSTKPRRPDPLRPRTVDHEISFHVRQHRPSSPICSQRLSPPSAASAAARNDELSDYIIIMQKYKNLPFDKDDDDSDDDNDSKSVSASTTATPSDLDPEDSISDGERDLKRQRTLRYNTRSSKARGKGKQVGWEDRFACNHGGTRHSKGHSERENPNARTIEVLQSMCDYYARTNDHWRTTAYRKAISTLRRQSATHIRTAQQAYALPNVGRRLADKIEEIVATDRLRKLDMVGREPADRALQLFLGVYGVGTSVAQGWVAKGFRTLDDLRAKAKLTPNQQVGVERYADLNARIPRREVAALAEYIKGAGREINPAVEMIVSGSYRRGADSSRDLDIIVTKKGTAAASSGKCRELINFLETLLERLMRERVVVWTLAALNSHGKDGGSKWHGCCVLPRHVAEKLEPAPVQSDLPPSGSSPSYNPIWRRVDFLLVPDSELGASLLYFTGNDIFNRSMRLLARKKGMRLNQHGLYTGGMRGPGMIKVTDGQLVEGRDERKIFDILGVRWREPEERWC